MKKKNDWRNNFVKREDFQCACGCELQLSAGDLADAIRCALPFGGKPRTWGVTYTTFGTPRDAKRDADEPIERQPCPDCRLAIVDIPAFAAQLLRDRDAPWPPCDDCMDARRERDHLGRDAREARTAGREPTKPTLRLVP